VCKKRCQILFVAVESTAESLRYFACEDDRQHARLTYNYSRAPVGN
jgi:hypothetical protein